MQKEIIKLEYGRLEVLIDDDLMYLKLFGGYTDKDAVSVSEFLENLFAETGELPVRVWDLTNLSKDSLEIITPGINIFFEWSRGVRMRWPDGIVYLINDKPIKNGGSGMYEPGAFFNDFSITVVKSIDELPDNIKERINLYNSK